MFQALTDRLSSAVATVRGRGRLTDENIADTLRQVRMALLEADVAVPVVKAFTEAVRARAVGEEVARSLTPGQTFIKILHEELVAVMGEPGGGLTLKAQPPVVVLLAGLQGAGKTTTTAKLALHLMHTRKKRLLLASTDVHRPAAMTQLERLATQVGADYFSAEPTTPAVEIAAAAVLHGRRHAHDVIILDTAGRLHIDEGMMEEVRAVDAAAQSFERLFVVDSMAGQDAINAARAFDAALALTGVILTKADGDARGGAALSVRHVTGKPILFLGVGEKIDALEVFHPERVASRILGMGDVVSLVEQVHARVDQDKAEALARKLTKGSGLDLSDLREQLKQLQGAGGLAAMLDKLPQGMLPAGQPGQVDDGSIRRQIAIIDSMTPAERRRPDIVKGSRRRRIAAGAGVQVQDVNRLLKQFGEMARVMKRLKGGGLRKMLRSLGGRLPGGMPGGLPPRR